MGSPEVSIRPYLLTLHGLLIVPLFIGLGGLWAAHVPNGWKPEKKKLSGISLIIFLTFLSTSGLLLYYLVYCVSQINLTIFSIKTIEFNFFFWTNLCQSKHRFFYHI